MLPAGWLVGAVALAVVLTMWVMFTLTRLDRLHARVDAAQAALDAQLVRRSAALLRVVESGESGVAQETALPMEKLAREAMVASTAEREAVENRVGRAIATLAGQLDPGQSATEELREATDRVVIARRFYNDAVRDTRTLRARRMPRLLHLAGHRDMPQFFDIDETAELHAESTTPRPPHADSVNESRTDSSTDSRTDSREETFQ